MYGARIARTGRGFGVLVLAMCFVLSGCSGGGPSNAKLSAAARAVLEDAGAPPQTQAKLDNAMQVLTQRCMRAKGLIFYPYFKQASSIPTSGQEFPPYGPLAQRRAEGYGLYATAVRDAESGTKENTPQGPTDPEDAYMHSLPSSAQARYAEALAGPDSARVKVTLSDGTRTSNPGAGCIGQASREIYGSVANYVWAGSGASVMRAQFGNSVASSPKFVAAMHKWSSCMAGQGFHYGAPYDAVNYFGAQYSKLGPKDSLQRAEIAVAVADWKCARQVSLVQVTNEVENELAARQTRTLEGNLLRVAGIEIAAAQRVDKLGLGT